MSRSCPDVAPGKSTPVLQRNSSFDDGGGFYLRRGETGNVLEKQTRMADLFVRDFSWVTVNSGIVPQFARVDVRPGFVSSCVRGEVSRTLKGYSSEKAAHNVLHMATTSPFFNKNWLLKTTRKRRC